MRLKRARTINFLLVVAVIILALNGQLFTALGVAAFGFVINLFI